MSSRMEDILGHEDPQSHVAAILQQADEAERRLRARLRKAPEDCGSGASYYGDGAWNRLNLGTGMPSSTTGRLGASGESKQLVFRKCCLIQIEKAMKTRK